MIKSRVVAAKESTVMKIWSLQYTIHVEHAEPIKFEKLVYSEHEPDGTVLADRFWKMLAVGHPMHVGIWGEEIHTVIKFTGNIAEVLLAVRVLVQPHNSGDFNPIKRLPVYTGPVVKEDQQWSEN